MRIIAEDDAISRYNPLTHQTLSDEELIDFIDKHKNQEIHILLVSINGNIHDELFIHNNIETLKQFAECNITFEYDDNGQNNYNIDDYKNNHIEGKRKDGNKVFTIKKIIDDEKFILDLAKEINKQEFSPLEKIFAIYNIGTSIKNYLEEPDNSGSEQSRSLYEFLNNTYIVCAGYVNFLETLCYLTDTPSFHERVIVENSAPHARLYINLVDEKYNINGYYVLDPTADSNYGKRFSIRSFDFFLITTSKSAQDHEDSYIDFLSYKSIASFKKDYNPANRDFLLDFFKSMDKDFAKQFESLDLSQDSDIQFFLDYLATKIDKDVDPDKIDQAKLVVASKIFRIPENTEIEDFLTIDEITTKETFDFLLEQGYKLEPHASKEIQLINILTFLYDIMYKFAVNDFNNNNYTALNGDFYPHSTLYKKAAMYSDLFAKDLTHLILSKEDPSALISTCKKNNLIVGTYGTIKSKVEQIRTRAQQAVGLTNNSLQGLQPSTLIDAYVEESIVPITLEELYTIFSGYLPGEETKNGH